MKITILKQTFNISTPYSEGHKINANEARALNNLRGENIANSHRKELKELLDEDGTLSREAHKVFEAKIADYDGQYTLATLTRIGGASPLERLCTQMAREMIADKLSSTGKTVKQYKEEIGTDAYNAKVAEVAAIEGVVAHAKEKLAAKAALTSGVKI